jgi:hypothetical protein
LTRADAELQKERLQPASQQGRALEKSQISPFGLLQGAKFFFSIPAKPSSRKKQKKTQTEIPSQGNKKSRGFSRCRGSLGLEPSLAFQRRTSFAQTHINNRILEIGTVCCKVLMSYIQAVHSNDKERVAFLHSLKVRPNYYRRRNMSFLCRELLNRDHSCRLSTQERRLLSKGLRMRLGKPSICPWHPLTSLTTIACGSRAAMDLTIPRCRGTS